MKNYNLFKKILLIEIIIFIVLILLNKSIFLTTITAYISLAFLFLFTKFSLWGISDLFPKKYKKNYNPYSVIVPVKDEKEENLVKCLRRIINSNGEKQILVGDDGSKIDIRQVLKKYPDIYCNISIIRNEKNIGKKNVQLQLIEKAKYEIIINIDSDILLNDKNTLIRLTAPFGKNKIGVANGNVRIINNKSLLHNLQDYLYFCANLIGRNSTGRFGINPCATGEIMAFRKDIFLKFVKEYQTAYYLGKPVRFGEDRLLTNIFLREGYDSIFVKEAKCWTYPKNTYKDFIKQQFRWRKSGIRESIRCLSFAYKKSPYLMFHSLFNFSLPILFFILLISIIIMNIISLSFGNLLTLFGVIITITTIADLPLLLENKHLIPIVIPFTLFNIFFITPLWIFALFNLNDNTWGTR
jgi:hyaluronan synthase